jgi:hypothetical protein
MPILPRPVSPRSAASDLLDYLLAHRAHKWPLLGLSAAMTWIIIWAFIVDANINTTPRRNQIIYIQNWDANRSDAAIIMQQKLDLAEYEVRLREQQSKMQKVADVFGVEWREDAARASAERAIALKQINARLDERLARAKKKGESTPATPEKPKP